MIDRRTQPMGEKPLLALDALSKLNRQFADHPEFPNLINTLLLTLSGQFSVASAFALLRKPGSADQVGFLTATGSFRSRGELETLILSPEMGRYFAEHHTARAVDTMELPAECSQCMDILVDGGVKLVCPLIHQDGLLGLIGLGPRVTRKEFSAEDNELLTALVGTVLPLVISAYHLYEIRSLSAWYLDILDNVKQGVFVFDQDQRLRKINRSGQALLDKYRPDLDRNESLLGTAMKDVFTEDKFTGWCKCFREARASGQARTIENLSVSLNDDEYIYEGYVTAVEADKEVSDSYLVTLEDVTERKAAVRKLREGRELLRATLESAADGILVVDENGRATHFNARFAEMWRVGSELLARGDDSELLNYVYDQLEDPDAFINKVKQLYQTTEESFDTLHFKDGRVFERFSCPLVQDSRIAGRVWSFRDITARVRAQEQQMRLQERLERAERMESLGILAGGVAHDLNNMLGPLVGYPELILMRLPDDSPYRKQLTRISTAAQEAADVVQDLLTLARRGRYEMAPTNLNSVVEAYLDSPNYARLIESRPNVNVTARLRSDLSNIAGSTPHLSKVIMNFVVNAFDAMPDGGNLTIETEQRYFDKLQGGHDKIDPGEYVVLRVRDTGQGIDDKDLGKIFEPYYSRKKMGRSGSGLGLSVVYGVIKDHKGYYDIFTKVGVGTEFVVYFPVTGQTVEEDEVTHITHQGHEKILVVDDMEDQREMAADLLSSLGYDVMTAATGREAIEIVRQHRADLVVLDMIIEKDFDGLDTYREIVKHQPGQKAVIVSGFSATARVREAQKLGAGEYLKKPYTRDAIGRVVRAELDRKIAET